MEKAIKKIKQKDFYYSYYGGKKDELKYFYKYHEEYKFKRVIEPFCGSCAFSTKYNKKHEGE